MIIYIQSSNEHQEEIVLLNKSLCLLNRCSKEKVVVVLINPIKEEV